MHRFIARAPVEVGGRDFRPGDTFDATDKQLAQLAEGSYEATHTPPESKRVEAAAASAAATKTAKVTGAVKSKVEHKSSKKK